MEKESLNGPIHFESLQRFIKSTLKLEGNWLAPGGHLKLFNEKSDSIIIIRYYTNTTSLLFQGDEGKKFMNILAKKITSNQSITIQEDKMKASVVPSECGLTEESSSDVNSDLNNIKTTDTVSNLLYNDQEVFQNSSNVSDSFINDQTAWGNCKLGNNIAMADNSCQTHDLTMNEN